MAVAAKTPLLENPLVVGLERLPVHPTSLVIFGVTGDLAKRKLLPALYNLAHDGSLPERFNLVGVARREISDEQFRELAARAVRDFSRRSPDEQVLSRLLDGACYVSGAADEESLYGALQGVLAGFDEEAGRRLNRCFYLATSPSLFPIVVRQLGHYGLNHREDVEVRVVIEKPFGTSLADARQLNHEVLSVFAEPQVFRIDH